MSKSVRARTVFQEDLTDEVIRHRLEERAEILETELACYVALASVSGGTDGDASCERARS
jgi:hypothetical protein